MQVKLVNVRARDGGIEVVFQLVDTSGNVLNNNKVHIEYPPEATVPLIEDMNSTTINLTLKEPLIKQVFDLPIIYRLGKETFTVDEIVKDEITGETVYRHVITRKNAEAHVVGDTIVEAPISIVRRLAKKWGIGAKDGYLKAQSAENLEGATVDI